MNSQVFRLLEADEVQQMLAVLGESRFVDGKATAYGIAREVKENLQSERTGGTLDAADEVFFKALARNAEFQAFTNPKVIQAPTYSAYEPGMRYGAHVDNALMGDSVVIRADFSMTLFLSSPESYAGGELAIRVGGGEDVIKLQAGEAVVYPSTSIHQVAPVTAGLRVAAVTWIQSTVRDAALREILWDLWNAGCRTGEVEDGELALLMSKTYQNLLRFAAEP